MRIVVTGGSGKGGAWVVRDLREHGHDVLDVDIRREPGDAGPGLAADLTDLGQTLDALAGAEAIVHFAAIPRARASARGRDLPDQRGLDLERLPGGGRAQGPAGRLGVERDGARPAVRRPARVRADRRDHRAPPRVVLRALEARRRDDGGPARPAQRDRLPGPAHLEHHGAGRLRAVPDVAGRPHDPEVEPVGLRGRA